MENNTLHTSRQHIIKIHSLQNNHQLDLLLSFVWNYSLEGEHWKEIKGFDYRYYCSNKGRILSLCLDGYKLLKPFLCGDGYYYVDLRKDNRDYKSRVHRLVADAFLPNPENKPIVHHIDTNRKNNNVENLMFVTNDEHWNIHKQINRTKKIP